MKNASLAELKAMGFARGKSIASWVDLPEIGTKTAREIDWVGIGTIETVEQAQEYFLCLCASSEENDRCYSPFEFTASAINARDDADEAWDAYQEGLYEGYTADWNQRKGFYGT